MDERKATVCTSARISDFNDQFCDTRCLHLYGMYDRCGLFGKLSYKGALHLFVRADACVDTFTEKQESQGRES